MFRRRHILAEDALKHLLASELAGGGVLAEDLATAMKIRRGKAERILAQLREQGLATVRGDGHFLTEEGRQQGLKILRSHRLYETWLARHSGLPPHDWHRTAQRAEHRLDAAAADSLADSLNNPRFDPHGDPIPTREGTLPAQVWTALPEWDAGAAAVVRHIEDEPEELFRQLDRLGLHPGMVLTEIHTQADGAITFRSEGRELVLASTLAALVQVAAVPVEITPDAMVRRLGDLRPGEEASIDSLSPACMGPERRRLLDLGMVPGTHIRCEFTSPFGSPRAYLVRGSLVALRREQAERILVRVAGAASPRFVARHPDPEPGQRAPSSDLELP